MGDGIVTDWTFEELVGDTGEFFSRHFGEQPLLRRGALDPARARDLVSVGRLDDLVTTETVPPAYLRIARAGQGVPGKAYTRVAAEPGTALTEAVVPEQVYELFRSGGTVTWNYLHHLLPSARRLVQAFARTFAAPAEAVAFLTPAGHDGYAPHHDPVDVFVVQTEGTKHWRVWEPAGAHRGEPATYPDGTLGEPALETTLHPGDVLYLPHGTPHAAAAGDQVSLHVSVTVTPRRWRDLLRETVEELTAGEEFAAVPHLDTPATGTGTAAQDGPAVAALAARLALLAERLTRLAPAAEAARLTETGRQRAGTPPPREFERLASLCALAPQDPLRRTRIPLAIGPSENGRTQLTVNGHTLAVPDAVATTLRLLEAGGSVQAGDLLHGAPAPRSVRAAESLTRLGLLEPATAAAGSTAR
ncbi:cupin domain-containing protein [Streptomyces sp. NPDC047014]|uniref:cupin domain-containing protein n=1 Tax=Streptomyces sp. NPDC047014 TaxID=3155736 RepID=UPI0033FBA9EC